MGDGGRVAVVLVRSYQESKQEEWGGGGERGEALKQLGSDGAAGKEQLAAAAAARVSDGCLRALSPIHTPLYRGAVLQPALAAASSLLTGSERALLACHKNLQRREKSSGANFAVLPALCGRQAGRQAAAQGGDSPFSKPPLAPYLVSCHTPNFRQLCCWVIGKISKQYNLVVAFFRANF